MCFNDSFNACPRRHGFEEHASAGRSTPSPSGQPLFLAIDVGRTPKSCPLKPSLDKAIECIALAHFALCSRRPPREVQERSWDPQGAGRNECSSNSKTSLAQGHNGHTKSCLEASAELAAATSNSCNAAHHSFNSARWSFKSASLIVKRPENFHGNEWDKQAE